MTAITARNIFLLLLMLVLAASPSFAAFTQSHLTWAIWGFENVNSPITQMCSEHLDKVLDGQTATDIPVLHYFDNEFMSYIGTHTRGSGHEACLESAGSDVELKCVCVGNALHLIPDSFFHNKGGVVPTYLEKYASLNLIGHMVIEKNFEDKLLAKVKDEEPGLYSKVEYYNKQVCNSFFEQTGGNKKFLKLFNEMSGIDMTNDANIFCNGYKGTGFYDTVYNQKLKLPFWFWGVSIGMIILGLTLAYGFFRLGETNWKFALVAIYLIIAILGGGILYSFYSGNTWQWIEYSVSVPAKFGVLSVSESDVEMYDKDIRAATKAFLETGRLIVDDASGLTYVDSEGVHIAGALNESEKRAKFIFLPILGALFLVLNIWLIRKSVG